MNSLRSRVARPGCSFALRRGLPARALLRLAAIAALVGAASTSSAQSSVQISGQVGVGATYRNHQGADDSSSRDITDNLLSISWLRFSGAEDLGDGWKALFRLETAVSLDTGVAGGPGAGGSKFWNRQSWVGLQMGQFGVLTFGRQYHAATDRGIRTFDVLNLSGSNVQVVPLALIGVNRFAGNDTRADNAVKYRLTVPGVVEFGASVAAAEQVAGRSYSADIAHQTAAYGIGAAYIHFNAPTRVALTGLLPEHAVWAVGGNLQLGPVKTYLTYLDSTLDSTVAGRLTQGNKLILGGLSWAVAPAVTINAAYYHDKGRDLNGVAGRDGNKDTAVLAGYYLLSKRTELYAAVFQNRFTDAYKLDPVNIAALNRAPGEATVSGGSVGIKHSF